MDQTIDRNEMDKVIAEKCRDADIILSNKDEIRQIAGEQSIFKA